MAGWNLLLHGGAYVPTAFGYDAILPLARGARGRDERGYRAEAIRPMELARDLGPAEELVGVGR